MITLYDLPISSYGCKIRIILRHKKIRWQNIAPPDGYGSDAYCRIIPTGTIPAISENGFILYESEAIAEYINEVQPYPAMLPSCVKQRATARALSRFHDSRIEPILRSFYPQISEMTFDKDLINKNKQLLQIRFNQLAKIITPQPFLCGDFLSLADCGFVPSFAILNRLQKVFGFSINLPDKIVHYETVLATHPSIFLQLEEYYMNLDQWIEQKQEAIEH